MTGSASTLLHGTVPMPLLGLGTYGAVRRHATRAVRWAVEAGYRLFDTASVYGNEKEIGEGILRSGLPREEVFVTTKVWTTDQGYESTLRAFEASRRRLGLEYVDLYLIHWPKPQLIADTWRALERLHREGTTRAIGVSNFEPRHLVALMSGAQVAPSVNQVELHPHLQQPAIRAACAELGIVVQAYSPLKRGRVLDDPVLEAIAARHEATAAQVVLRWQIQSGISTIPKSVHHGRIHENADLFDFELTPHDVAAIASLDRG